MVRTVSLCAALVTCALACGRSGSSGHSGDDAGRATPAPAPLRSTTLQQPGPQSPPPPPLPVPIVDRIEVLAPGKGARRVLRYHPTKPWTLTVEARLHGREKIDTHTAYDLDVPAFHYGLAVTGVGTRGKAGVTRLQLRGTKAGAEGGQGSEVAASFVAQFRKLIEDRRVWLEVDARGVIDGAHLVGVAADDQVPGILRETRQLFYSATVPLPNAPIAPGARWKVTSRVERAGVIVKQTATYQLVAAEGDRLTVDADVEQVGEQQLVAPEDGSNDVAELHAFVWKATGRLAVNLSMVTASGDLSIDQRVHGRVRAGGRVADVYDAVTGTLSLSSRHP